MKDDSSKFAALSKLDVFVGEWNTKGRVDEGPFGPAQDVVGTDSYEWMNGGHFLIHRADVTMGGDHKTVLELIGYDEPKRAYFMQFFDSEGGAGQMEARVDGRRWLFAGDSLRFTGEFSPGNAKLFGNWEYASSPNQWKHLMTIELSKK